MGTPSLSLTKEKEPTFATSFTKAVQNGIGVTVEVAGSVEGLKQISDVGSIALTFIAHAWGVVLPSLTMLGTCMSNFLDVASAVDMVKRLKNWACADDSGKMMWEKSWQHVAAISCVTFHHLFNFLTFLGTTLKVIALGAAALPLSVLNQVSNFGYGVFDLWTMSMEIKEVKEKMVNISKAKDKWAKRATEVVVKDDSGCTYTSDWSKKLEERQIFWKNRVVTLAKTSNEKEKLSKARARLLQWSTLKDCSPEETQKFCNKKVEHLKLNLENHNKMTTKAWVTAAFDAALVAFSIFAIVMMFVTPIWMATTVFLISAFVTSGLELSTTIVDKALKIKDLQPVELPIPQGFLS